MLPLFVRAEIQLFELEGQLESATGEFFVSGLLPDPESLLILGGCNMSPIICFSSSVRDATGCSISSNDSVLLCSVLTESAMLVFLPCLGLCESLWFDCLVISSPDFFKMLLMAVVVFADAVVVVVDVSGLPS